MATTVVTDASFEADVLKIEGLYILVDFWAEWCGPCRMLAPVLEKVAQTFPSQLRVVKLDTDANPKTSQDYQITGIPCCILFKEGKEVSRFVGYRTQSAFESDLRKVFG